jgi:GLPGLI family protein
MNKWILTSITILCCSMLQAQPPKIISDATISFSVNNTSASKQKNLGSKIIYLKGKDIRVDLVSNMFSQTIFYNSNTGNATILKNIGQSKYISNYTADEWKKANNMYNGVIISYTNETKKILGYECKQAILKLKNGGTYTVYYTPLLVPSVMENPFEFKDIPGLILEYESSITENEKVIYTAEKISFDPVPSLQFEIPKTGYRVLH